MRAVLRFQLWLLAAASLFLGTQAGFAHSDGEPSTGIAVSPILATTLEETEDRHASLALATLQPSAVSAPHRHPGTVIVYVLEGEVESALDDEAPQTFVAGQA
jgi:quercetin dioxygenase-like cupin family protein